MRIRARPDQLPNPTITVVAVGGGIGVEPASAGSGQDALLGVSENAREVAEVDVGVAQVALCGVTADVVHECGESGAFAGQPALQGPGVHAEVLCCQADGERSSG